MSEWDTLIESTAQQVGIDPKLLRAVVAQESGGNARAVSPAGAQGLMQLMPGTAKELGVTDPFDPAQNISGGARYLKQQLDTFGELPLALAAYNAGPGNVRKHGGIPPFDETQNYVQAITQALGQQGTSNMPAPMMMPSVQDQVTAPQAAQAVGNSPENPFQQALATIRELILPTAQPGQVNVNVPQPPTVQSTAPPQDLISDIIASLGRPQASVPNVPLSLGYGVNSQQSAMAHQIAQDYYKLRLANAQLQSEDSRAREAMDWQKQSQTRQMNQQDQALGLDRYNSQLNATGMELDKSKLEHDMSQPSPADLANFNLQGQAILQGADAQSQQQGDIARMQAEEALPSTQAGIDLTKAQTGYYNQRGDGQGQQQFGDVVRDSTAFLNLVNEQFKTTDDMLRQKHQVMPGMEWANPEYMKEAAAHRADLIVQQSTKFGMTPEETSARTGLPLEILRKAIGSGRVTPGPTTQAPPIQRGDVPTAGEGEYDTEENSPVAQSTAPAPAAESTNVKAPSKKDYVGMSPEQIRTMKAQTQAATFLAPFGRFFGKRAPSSNPTHDSRSPWRR